MMILELAALLFMVGVLSVFYAGMASLLTALRRGRPVECPAATEAALAAPIRPPHVRYAEPLPDAWRLPVQPGRPNDVIILIEPEEKINPRRSAIERIITHFEERAS